MQGVGAATHATASSVSHEHGTWLWSAGRGMLLREECLRGACPLLPCLGMWCAACVACALTVSEACSGASGGRAAYCGSSPHEQVHLLGSEHPLAAGAMPTRLCWADVVSLGICMRVLRAERSCNNMGARAGAVCD